MFTRRVSFFFLWVCVFDFLIRNLPDAEAGPNGKYGGSGGTKSTEDSTPYGHLRKVFYRMGLNDEEIVALSGAHT